MKIKKKIIYNKKNTEFVSGNAIIDREVGFFSCAGLALREKDIGKQLGYYFENTLTPMYNYEHYTKGIKISKDKKSLKSIKMLANSIQSITDGDLIDSQSMKKADWSIKKYIPVMGCVGPVVIGGCYKGMASFPQYFNKMKAHKDNLTLKLI